MQGLLSCTLSDLDQRCQLTTSQKLIGETLEASPAIIGKWWATLWFPTLWLIWLARIAETIHGRKEAPLATKRKIWQQTCLYLKVGWKRRRAQVLSGNLTKEEAAYKFCFDYGQNDSLFKIVDMELWVVDYPLEPN